MERGNSSSASSVAEGILFQEPDADVDVIDGEQGSAAGLVESHAGNEESKKNMRTQLRQWRDNGLLSEFSEPMRAIYELLGGNVCATEGNKDATVEEKVDSFIISKHFGLDWRQAFGLRLWYGAAPQDDIAVAVRMFADDIDQDKESRPIPWYAEQRIKHSGMTSARTSARTSWTRLMG